MSNEPHPQQPRPAAPEPAKKNPKHVAIGCTTILALLVIIIVIAVAATNDSDSKPSGETAAAVMCEDFVKQRLKSPATADFPGVTDADYATTKVLSDTKPWKYQVTGVVDSQNGFGATVRSNYVCTVSTKDNDTWTLNDLDLTQR